MIYLHAGWLRRFMKRKGLSLWRKTTVSQTTPEDCIPKLVSFIVRLRALQINHGYPQNSIFAMDETACWMDMPSDTTVALRGEHSVPVKSTGHEKSHFTVILTARANGTKMKPFVVFKGKGTRLLYKRTGTDPWHCGSLQHQWMDERRTHHRLSTQYCWDLLFQQTTSCVGCIPLPHQCSSSG